MNGGIKMNIINNKNQENPRRKIPVMVMLSQKKEENSLSLASEIIYVQVEYCNNLYNGTV